MEIYGTATGSANLQFEKDTFELRASWIKSLKPGTAVKEVLTRYYPKKSHQQVKTMWGLLIETVKRDLDEKGFDMKALFPTSQVPDGIPVPREILMQLFYAVCNDVGESGERKTLSQMTTIEAATFFENCRDHAARCWGIIVPDPDPNWRERL